MFVALGTVAGMKRDAKINVMLTKEELQALEDAIHKRRQRSISTFVRDILAKYAEAEDIEWPAEKPATDA